MKELMRTALLAAVAAAGFAEGVIDLDGKWQLDYFPQPDEGAIRTPVIPEHSTVEATVPGNCELDLVKAGILPPPEIGLNVMKLWPYEGYQWLYTKKFAAGGRQAGERAMLVLEGVDTLADVFLNGEKVGETENMLIPHEFDVTKMLKDGENTLQVLLRSVRIESQYKSMGELGYSLGGINLGDGEAFRKAGHMGGWDIFPRVFAAGLWRGVRIKIQRPVRIDETAWIVDNLKVKEGSAAVYGRYRVQAPFRCLGKGKVVYSVSRNGKQVGRHEEMFKGYHNQFTLWVSGIECWWPRGMGESPLYDAKIEIFDEGGKSLAVKTEKIGFRTVKLERDDIYGGERKGQFRFVVNGEPCYIRGSNWVPLDSFHGRDGLRMRETLEMFKDLNCNMIRVWGGGVYEPKEFFEFCDENGIMVWQDFMTGCSVFPQTDEYAKATAEEIRSVVKQFRNHASLALWSGNNENDMAFNWGNPPSFRRNPNLDRNSRRTIPEALFDLDVSRAYLPSSPYVSEDVAAGRAKASEDHLWGARGYYKTPFYTNSACWFASEMGYHGCPNRESLERMMTKGCVYPWKEITGGDPKKDYHWNDEWQFKASNPFLEKTSHLNERNSLMTNQAKILFGEVPTELDDFIAASQIVQAEAMKTFVERFRGEKFVKKNGLIWWNVRDGWPQISDAVVDYYGGKKRAYAAIKSVQQDELVMLFDDHRAVAVNDRRHPVKGHARFTDKASGKVLLERDYEVGANGIAELGEVPFEGQGLVSIEYSCDGLTLSNHFLHGLPPFKLDAVRKWLDD